MKTAAQEWSEEALAKGLIEGEAIGIQKGEVIGLQKGMLQAHQKMIVQILQHRFAPPKEIVEQLGQQLAQITSTEAMQQLADYALQTLLLHDFLLRVERFLPAPIQPGQEAQQN